MHYQNPEEKTYISLIPTSAHTGDGMGDLMAVICRLTQTRLAKKLAFSKELESTVMEVKLTLLMPICLAFWLSGKHCHMKEYILKQLTRKQMCSNKLHFCFYHSTKVNIIKRLVTYHFLDENRLWIPRILHILCFVEFLVIATLQLRDNPTLWAVIVKLSRKWRRHD